MPRSPVYRYPGFDRECIVCGERIPFWRRRDRAYCSDACRQRAYRARSRNQGAMTKGQV